jgi:hypothetical protein
VAIQPQVEIRPFSALLYGQCPMHSKSRVLVVEGPGRPSGISRATITVLNRSWRVAPSRSRGAVTKAAPKKELGLVYGTNE